MRQSLLAISLAISCALSNGDVQAGDLSVLDAKVISEDADRFAAIFEASNGKPSAEALLKGYLEPGTEGVRVFTKGRIKNAEHLAKTIAENPELYRRGIDVCLPIAKEMTDVLRSVYLGLNGLLNYPELPKVYVVFGAGNSGGTAGEGSQVMGLEVICRISKTEEEIRRHFRHVFAHETVHTLQKIPSDKEFIYSDYLLLNILAEGGADYIAKLVTGTVRQPKRDAWARQRYEYIRTEFLNDRAKIKNMTPAEISKKGSPRFRWVRNAKKAPDEGWPGELGYWVGREIWAGYFEQAEDKEEALKDLLYLRNPQEVLEKSGYLKPQTSTR